MEVLDFVGGRFGRILLHLHHAGDQNRHLRRGGPDHQRWIQLRQLRPDEGGARLGHRRGVHDARLLRQRRGGHPGPGFTTKSFDLDPLGRITSSTVSGQFISGTTTNHYAGDDDSPAWIDEVNGTWTRNIVGFSGVDATLTGTGTIILQLANPHGDIVATADRLGSGVSAYFEQTEYGAARAGNITTPARYGWLGSEQRSIGDTIGGLILMGVRLYNPATGRFLQRDPIPGGSANDYEYGRQDPCNNEDLSGQNTSTYAVRTGVVRGFCTTAVTLATAQGRGPMTLSIQLTKSVAKQKSYTLTAKVSFNWGDVSEALGFSVTTTRTISISGTFTVKKGKNGWLKAHPIYDIYYLDYYEVNTQVWQGGVQVTIKRVGYAKVKVPVGTCFTHS